MRCLKWPCWEEAHEMQGVVPLTGSNLLSPQRWWAGPALWAGTSRTPSRSCGITLGQSCCQWVSVCYSELFPAGNFTSFPSASSPFPPLLAALLSYFPACAASLPVAVHWCHLFGCSAFIFCHLCGISLIHLYSFPQRFWPLSGTFKCCFLLAFQHIAIQGDVLYHNEENITLFFYMLSPQISV